MFHLYTGQETQPWMQAAELTQDARLHHIPVLVVVPQQYTLTAERALIEILKTDGFFDVDVVSPLRLSQRVFSEVGSDERIQIDDLGKMMAISHVIHENSSSLSYYESAVERHGFIEGLARMIAEMKRARIDPEQLETFRNELNDEASAEKFNDLIQLYRGYEELLSGQFVDGEDVQTELMSRARESGMIRDSRIIVAGFDMLTMDTAQLLMAIEPVAESVSVILCADSNDPVYSPANDSVIRLVQQLRERGIHFRHHQMKSAFSRPEDIVHLAHQLLQPQPAPYLKTPANIRLYAAPIPYAEACHAAEEIVALHAKGFSWQEMLIVCADEPHYFSVVDHVLNIYQIPHHIARKTTASQMGPARFLLSAMAAIAHHYRQEDMLRLIKTGYLDLTEDECYRLENMILQYGLQGWKMTKPFIIAKEEGALLEDARQRMMEPLIGLEKSIHEADSMETALKAIIAFLDASHTYERMNEELDQLAQAHQLMEADKLRQVWDCMMNLMDQAYAIGRQDHPDIDMIYHMLEAGLGNAGISALPQEAASVPCGLLGNIPIHHPRVTFILGLNDGVLNDTERGLIAEEEQEAINNKFDVSCALSQDERLQLKKLYLIKAMYSPSDFLYLSHAQALQDGTALRTLDLLNRVKRIFPALIEEGGVTASQGPSHPYGVMPALESIGTRLRTGVLLPEWQQAWYYLNVQCPEKVGLLKASYYPETNPESLTPELVHSLYLERVTSVNRLEAFAVCPFRHFLRYGLKPARRGAWKINRTDEGSFYHRALEGFTRKLQTLESWPNVTKNEVSRLMDQSADEALDDLIIGVLGDSAVKKREYRQYKRLLQRVGWTFTQIAQHSAFRAGKGDAELKFGYPDDGLPAVPLCLSDGSRVYVRGVIDRVERYVGDQGLAIRLIDYKTPNTALQPEKIFWGTQLQLLIYMQAVLNAEPNGIPAGMYYFHLNDPLLDDPDVKTDIESQLAKALNLKGITLRDAAIIRLMDDGKPPLSMPALLKADGDFAQNKPLATLDEMRMLIRHANKVAAYMAESIKTGDIKASPIVFPNDVSPCSSCEAADVCRHNASNSCVAERNPDKMTLSELLEVIGKE